MKQFLITFEECYTSTTARTIKYGESIEDYSYEDMESSDMDCDLVLGLYEAETLVDVIDEAGKEQDISVDLLKGYEIVRGEC